MYFKKFGYINKADTANFYLANDTSVHIDCIGKMSCVYWKQLLRLISVIVVQYLHPLLRLRSTMRQQFSKRSGPILHMRNIPRFPRSTRSSMTKGNDRVRVLHIL